MKTHPAGLGTTLEDYRKLHLSPDHVAQWEDGIRTQGKKGDFEWWYFDAHLDDGSTLVIVFYTKSIYDPVAGFAPFASFQLERPDGTYLEKECPVSLSEFSASSEKCDVRMGKNTFVGDLRDYRIHFEMDDVKADVMLRGTVPAWRPYTGHCFFGEQKDCFFAWLPSVPQGSVEVQLSAAGKSEVLTGFGYHDHNWGDAPMANVLHHWYWTRAKVGDWTVIASDVFAAKKYGYQEVPVFVLAKNGEILADDSLRCISFSADGHFINEATGKPNYKTLVFVYDDPQSGQSYRITFRHERDVDEWKFVDKLSGVKRLAAKAIGFDGAYLRVGGSATVEDLSTGESVQEPALWETMYFGKNLDRF